MMKCLLLVQTNGYMFPSWTLTFNDGRFGVDDAAWPRHAATKSRPVERNAETMPRDMIAPTNEATNVDLF